MYRLVSCREMSQADAIAKDDVLQFRKINLNDCF